MTLLDDLAAPNLLQDAWEYWHIGGHRVRVERTGEIIAKKMYHRGHQASARDLFDLCLVIEREPEALDSAVPFLARHRDAFLARIQEPSVVLEAAFEAIDTRNYAPTLAYCVDLAKHYLESC